MRATNSPGEEELVRELLYVFQVRESRLSVTLSYMLILHCRELRAV